MRISKEEVTNCKSETFKAILDCESCDYNRKCEYCYKTNLKLFKIERRKEMKGNLTQILNTQKRKPVNTKE